MTPETLAQQLLEEFDPDEVEAVAASIDTDIHHLHQTMELLQGAYPHVMRPMITYWQSEPGVLDVNIEFDWDADSTSPWTIANLVHNNGHKIGINFASHVAIVDDNRDQNPGWSKLWFSVYRKSKTPITGTHRIEESSDGIKESSDGIKESFDPEEVEKLAQKPFMKKHNWRKIDQWSGGGAWYDSVTNEMLVWDDQGEDSTWPGARVLVHRFPAQPIESNDFIDIPQLLFDVDIDPAVWDKSDNLQKLAVAAGSGYGDMLDQRPMWYTRVELKRILKSDPD